MKKLFLLVFVALTAFMASCGEKPEVFVMGSSNFSGDFYSGWTNSSYDKDIRDLVWGSGLVAQTPDGRVVDGPIVEERITSKSDPSKEADDVWKFTLKKGLKFSNGNPLTAKDVKYTYELFMDAEALKETGGNSSLNEYISKIELDEKKNSVTFTLKEIMYTTDTSVFSENILDSTLIEKGVKEDGLTPQQWIKAHISEAIGYGPYKIIEYIESQYVKLDINPNFIGDVNGDKPSIQTLIVQNVPDETSITQLLTGEIDALTGLGKDEKIEAVKEADNLSTNNYYRHGGGQITYHSDYGPVQLKEVRHAFAYMFNRVKFRDLFLGKYGISSNAPYSRNMWMMYEDGEKLGEQGSFEKTLTNYDIMTADGGWDREANLAKTRELLDLAAERTDGLYAKLTKDTSGTYMWEGKPLSLNLAISSFWADAINLTITKDVQEDFGIQVNLESMDWSIMASHLYGNASASERKYHMFTGGTGYTLKSDPYSDFSGTKLVPFGEGSSPNTGRLASDADLLDKIRFSNPSTEEGTANYKKYWREWIVSVNEELPKLPLYSNNYYDAYTNKIENFETNALWEWPAAIVKARFKK